MTIMNLKFPDDLIEAVRKAFPSESLEQVVERLLRAAVSKRQPEPPVGSKSLVDTFRDIAREFGPMTDDEIRRLRHEGRP